MHFDSHPFKWTSCHAGTLDIPSVLARLTPRDLAYNFKLQLARRADNSVPLYEHGNKAPKVILLLSLLQQAKYTLPTLIVCLGLLYSSPASAHFRHQRRAAMADRYSFSLTTFSPRLVLL